MAAKTKPRKREPVEAEWYKVRITSGDSFIRLPNRMLVVEEDHVIVTAEELTRLKDMKVTK